MDHQGHMEGLVHNVLRAMRRLRQCCGPSRLLKSGAVDPVPPIVRGILDAGPLGSAVWYIDNRRNTHESGRRRLTYQTSRGRSPCPFRFFNKPGISNRSGSWVRHVQRAYFLTMSMARLTAERLTSKIRAHLFGRWKARRQMQKNVTLGSSTRSAHAGTIVAMTAHLS